MTEEVAPALAQALKQQGKLIRLNLNDTSLKDEGITAVAEVWFVSFSQCHLGIPDISLVTKPSLDLMPCVLAWVSQMADAGAARGASGHLGM